MIRSIPGLIVTRPWSLLRVKKAAGRAYGCLHCGHRKKRPRLKTWRAWRKMADSGLAGESQRFDQTVPRQRSCSAVSRTKGPADPQLESEPSSLHEEPASRRETSEESTSPDSASKAAMTSAYRYNPASAANLTRRTQAHGSGTRTESHARDCRVLLGLQNTLFIAAAPLCLPWLSRPAKQ